jgi:hypothetical protein
MSAAVDGIEVAEALGAALLTGTAQPAQGRHPPPDRD